MAFMTASCSSNNKEGSSNNKPIIVKSTKEQAVKLPKALANQLDRTFPDYRIPNENDFTKGSDWDLYARGKDLPFALNSDFNADAENDLALLMVHKRNFSNFMLVAFMSSKEGYELVDISQGRIITSPAPVTQYSIFLHDTCIAFFRYESEAIYYCHTENNSFEIKDDEYH
jgi:hypothetical protein